MRVRSRIGEVLLLFMMFMLLPGQVLQAQEAMELIAYVGDEGRARTDPATQALRYRIESGDPGAVAVTLGNGGFTFKCMRETVSGPVRITIYYRDAGGRERQSVAEIFCSRRDHPDVGRDRISPEPPRTPDPPDKGE